MPLGRAREADPSSEFLEAYKRTRERPNTEFPEALRARARGPSLVVWRCNLSRPKSKRAPRHMTTKNGALAVSRAVTLPNVKIANLYKIII